MSAPNPLFLREEELDRGLDLLTRAGMQVIADARELLAEAALGEGEHRILQGIERRPGSTLADLAPALGLSKQTLSRQLKALIERGLVEPPSQGASQDASQVMGQVTGQVTDRRKRPLRLAPATHELLTRIKAVQKRRLRQAFKSAGGLAVEGFERVLGDLVGESERTGGQRFRARLR